MGRDANADFAVVFGIVIPTPTLPDAPEKKRAQKDTNEEVEEEAEDEDDGGYGTREDLTAQQAFNVVHELVIGSNTETGLRLAILIGLVEQGHREFGKIYLIEYTPSRVHEESLQSGHAVSLANVVAPPAQVTSDIFKLLKYGFEIQSECEPGWVAIATCNRLE